MTIMNWVQVSFIHEKIISAVKRVVFLSDRMSYIILRGLRYITVLNVPVQTDDKTDDMKDGFCEEL
jgi:hypothetical protein